MISDLLKIFGGVSLFVLVGFALVALWVAFTDWLSRAKYNYRVRHRFDKPPTAKCYCVDCKHHDNESMRCYRFTECRCTADNWFCWEAWPDKNKEKKKTDGQL